MLYCLSELGVECDQSSETLNRILESGIFLLVREKEDEKRNDVPRIFSVIEIHCNYFMRQSSSIKSRVKSNPFISIF